MIEKAKDEILGLREKLIAISDQVRPLAGGAAKVMDEIGSGLLRAADRLSMGRRAEFFGRCEKCKGRGYAVFSVPRDPGRELQVCGCGIITDDDTAAIAFVHGLERGDGYAGVCADQLTRTLFQPFPRYRCEETQT